MANKKTIIYVVQEAEGPHLVKAFLNEIDANNYFHHEVAAGTLCERYYKVGTVTLEDFDKWM